MTTQWSSTETSTADIAQSSSPQLMPVSLGTEFPGLKRDLESTVEVLDDGLRLTVPTASFASIAIFRLVLLLPFVFVPMVMLLILMIFLPWFFEGPDGLEALAIEYLGIEHLAIGGAALVAIALAFVFGDYRRLGARVVLNVNEDRLKMTRSWFDTEKVVEFQRRDIDMVEEGIEGSLVLHAGGKKYHFGLRLEGEEQGYLALVIHQAIDGLLEYESLKEEQERAVEDFPDVARPPENPTSSGSPGSPRSPTPRLPPLEHTPTSQQESNPRPDRVVLPPWLAEAAANSQKTTQLQPPVSDGITEVWVQGSELIIDILPTSADPEELPWWSLLVFYAAIFSVLGSMATGSLLVVFLVVVVSFVVVVLLLDHFVKPRGAERLVISEDGLAISGGKAKTIALEDLAKVSRRGFPEPSRFSRPAIVFVDSNGKKTVCASSIARRKTSYQDEGQPIRELKWVYQVIEDHLERVRPTLQ